MTKGTLAFRVQLALKVNAATLVDQVKVDLLEKRVIKVFGVHPALSVSSSENLDLKRFISRYRMTQNFSPYYSHSEHLVCEINRRGNFRPLLCIEEAIGKTSFRFKFPVNLFHNKNVTAVKLR